MWPFKREQPEPTLADLIARWGVDLDGRARPGLHYIQGDGRDARECDRLYREITALKTAGWEVRRIRPALHWIHLGPWRITVRRDRGAA